MQVESNPLSDEVTRIVEKSTGKLVVSAATLAGGLADAKHVVLSDGSQVTVKLPMAKADDFAIEGATLAYLKEHTALPIAHQYYSGSEALVHEYIIADGTLQVESETCVAAHLIELHKITSDKYGFDFDTLYCGIVQPNAKKDKWVSFFIENRLLYMARLALESGKLPIEMMRRIENFCEKMEAYLDEPERPSLLHGKVDQSSVLCYKGEIRAFVDPAIFFGDREFEFCFASDKSPLSPLFFKTYNETFPFRPGYLEYRREIYNLYPLLLNIVLLGQEKLPLISKTLSRFGF